MIFAWSIQRLGYAVEAARNRGWDVFVFAVVSRRGCGLLDGNHRLDQDTAPVECFQLIVEYCCR